MSKGEPKDGCNCAICRPCSKPTPSEVVDSLSSVIREVMCKSPSFKADNVVQQADEICSTPPVDGAKASFGLDAYFRRCPVHRRDDEKMVKLHCPKEPDPRPFKVGDLVRISDEHRLALARGRTIQVSEIDSGDHLYGELPDYGRIGVDPKNATLVDEDGEQTVSQPKSGRTTAMVLDVVLRAVRGQDVRVIADLPFDECFSLCTWIKRMGECAIPGFHRPAVKSCAHGFSVRFAGIAGEGLEPIVYSAVIEVVPKRSSVEGLRTEGWYVCDENGVEL